MDYIINKAKNSKDWDVSVTSGPFIGRALRTTSGTRARWYATRFRNSNFDLIGDLEGYSSKAAAVEIIKLFYLGEHVELKPKPMVFICSPYRGEVGRNVGYARQCVRDSMDRGEVPQAYHLLYTQEGILDDDVPADRRLGTATALAAIRHMDLVAVYEDHGISEFMEIEIARAGWFGKEIDKRTILP